MSCKLLGFIGQSVAGVLASSRLSLGLICIGVCLSPGCDSSGTVGRVRGAVSVDAAPVDIGTISFRPAASPGVRGSGAAIVAGNFQLPADHGLKPGAYRVTVQASKKTGKIIQDPQRGKVPELATLTLIDSPQEVELSHDNAANLSLTFHTK